MSRADKARGFTLMELAIVLVVVSFVIGGVVAGRNMIAATELKATVSETNDFAFAMQRYRETYGYLPGDTPNASSFFTGVTNGNGNGILDSGEELLFWQHLSSSGFLKDHYDGATDAPGSGLPEGSREGTGYAVASDAAMGMIFEFTSYSGGSGGKAALSPKDAWNIDKMFDDGNPTTGTIRSDDGSDTPGGCIGGTSYELDSGDVGCILKIAVDRSGTNEHNALAAAVACGVIGDTQVSATACPAGYTGEIIETCTIDGTWQESHFNCNSISCGVDHVDGDTRSVECPAGYTGDITQVCTAGVWEVQTNNCVAAIDTCDAETAGSATWIETNENTVGVAGTCIAGYGGTPTRDCGNNGVWGAVTGPCAALTCGATTASNADWPLSTAGTSNVAGTCVAGYAGTPTRDCDITGGWGAITGSCAATCTTPSNPTNGTSGAASLNGSTWESIVTCNSGYDVSGSPSTCTVGNSWTMATCAAACSTPANPANGTAGAAAWSSGSSRWESTVTCNGGYSPSSTPRTCTTGNSWSAGSCVANCSTPANPANGTAGGATWNGGASRWESTITCSAGYTSSGSPRTCTSGNSWSAGSCAANCSTPANPANGTSGAASWNGGASRWESTLTCDAGYTATATPRTCTAANSWSAESCAASGCGATPTISNVVFTAGTSAVGDTRVAKCDSATWYWGMPTTYTCSAGLTWTGTPPTCYLLDCSGASCSGTGNPQECTVPATCAANAKCGADPATPAYGAITNPGNALLRNSFAMYKSSSGHGTGSYTTPSFTPPSNSLLVVTAGGMQNGGTADIAGCLTITDSQALTWTARTSAADTDDWAMGMKIWTAPVTAGAAMTITFDCGVYNIWSYTIDVAAYTNYDTSSPVGAIVPASVTVNNPPTDGAFSVTLNAAPKTTSEVYAVLYTDTDNIQTVAPGTGWTELGENRSTPDDNMQHTQVRSGSASTSVAWNDVNELATVWKSIGTAIEIKAAASNAKYGNYREYQCDTCFGATANSVAAQYVCDNTSGWKGKANSCTQSVTNRWVAVARGGQIATSPDGTTWTIQTDVHGTEDIVGVAFNGSNLWVAVGDGWPDYAGAKISTSPDGITWTARTPPSGFVPIQAVEHNRLSGSAGLWVIAGNQMVATSSDGITWTTRTSNIPSGKDVCSIDHNWQSGASGLWVIGLCSQGTVTSPDGITWTYHAAVLGGDVDGTGNNHLSGASNLWVVIGDGPAMKTAPDGLTWTARTSNLVTWGHGVIHNAQSVGGLWVVGDAGGNISTSTNGTAWTARGDIGNAVEALGSNYKTGGTDLFVAAQDGGVIKTSPDGVTWTTRVDPFGAEDVMDVAFGSMYTTPPSSPNGTTSYSKSGTTWTNTLVCDPGYTVSGNATSTCTSGSNAWTALGTCVSNTCGSLPTITNVVFAAGGSSSGDTRVAKCDSTTWYWGMPTTYTCTSGSWTGTAPTCHLLNCSGTNCGLDPQECTVPATCGGLSCSTAPDQTGATITESVNGSNYAGYSTYTCDMCFGYSGTAGKLMCDNTSGWKGSAAICTASQFYVTGEFGTVDAACCAANPNIAVLSATVGVITWEDWNARDGSGAGVYFQRGDSSGALVGSEVRVNATTSGDQYYSPVIGLSTGGYVVGWNGPGGGDAVNTNAFFQRYNSSGVAQGTETIMTSAATANTSWAPDLVLLPSDSFMALWEAPDTDGAGIWGRVFTSAGVASTAIFQINTYATTQQKNPEGAKLTGGNVAVIWASNGVDGNGWGVTGQIVTTAGVKVGSEFRVNTYVTGNQGTGGASGANVGKKENYDIAPLANGGFVVTWDSTGQDGDLTGIYAQRFDSAGVKAGGEIRVNSMLKGDQKEPTIVALANNYFMIFWMSDNIDGSGTAIVGQLFGPQGNKIRGERLINSTTATDQRNPEAVMNPDGNVSVVFLSNNRIYYRIIRPLAGYSPPTTFPVTGESLVNTYTSQDQYYQNVGTLADGGYIVIWKSHDQDGDQGGIYFQRYNQTGTAVGAETRANTYTAGDQYGARAVGLKNGGWVIMWRGPWTSNTTGYDAMAQFYDAKGTAVGSNILVGRTGGADGDTSSYPDMVELPNGNLLFVSHGNFVDASSNGIAGRLFDQSGTSVAAQFTINTYTANNQRDATAALLKDGNIAVTWTDIDGHDGSGNGVYAQRINSSGTKVGAELRMNTYSTGNQFLWNIKPIVALANGGFVVTWESDGQDGDQGGIYAQIIGGGGLPSGSEFRVNTTTAGNQISPTMVALTNSYFMIFWESENHDGIGTSIVGQLFDSSGTKVGGERQINQVEGGSSGNQHEPAATVLENGNVVVVWNYQPSSGTDTSGYSVWQRTINPFVAEAPLDIIGLKLWLKADAGITKDGSNKVSAWAGQSGTLNPASQGTAANQPLWVANGLNGYPVIRFDGTDDYMNMHASYVDILKNVKGGSIFVVEKRNGVGGAGGGASTHNSLLDISTNSASNPRIQVVVDDTNTYKITARRSDADSAATLLGGASATTSFNLVSSIVDYNAADAYLYVDGTLANSNTTFLTSGSTSNTNSVTVRLGAKAMATPTGHLNGDIAEVLVFNRTLLDSNRKAVECYLARKYNLTLGYTCPSEVAGTAATTAGMATMAPGGLTPDRGIVTYGYNGGIRTWTSSFSCQSPYSVSGGGGINTCDPTTGAWLTTQSPYCTFSIAMPTTVSTLKLWLDASDTASITQASGRASQWNDKSGQGNHVLQATAAAKPYTGSRTYNGLNVMDFQNAQYMNSANPWASGTLAQPNTMFVVASQDALAYDYIIDGNGGGYHALGSNSATNYFMIAVTPEVPIYTSGITPDTTPKIFSLMFNDNPDSTNSSALYVNGTPYLTGGNAGALGINNIYVGGWPGNEIDGFIGEVLVYDGLLTPTDRERVECYLSNKWAVGLQHPCQ